ncbi:MAG: hypothetical protein Q8O72_00985 [Bacteroidales bacterium]|nr:hypothetical protein [Bacteroidales bacterium]
MKTQHLFLLILINIPIIGFSQIKSESNFEYEVGEPHPFINTIENYYFYKNNEVLTIKLNRQNIVIQKINTTKLNTISTNFYDDFPKRYSVEYVGIIDDRYFIFYSIWNYKTNSYPLYCREINFEKACFKSEAILFIEPNFVVKDLFSISFSSAKQSFVDVTNNPFSTYGFYFNRDHSRVLINYRRDPKVSDKDKDFDVLGFHVFDNKLKELWSKDICMPYPEKKMTTIDFSIDSYGNAYVVAAVIDGKGSKTELNNEIPNYHIELIRINSSTNDVEKFPILIENKFLNTVFINQGKDDEMICTGYYSYADNPVNVAGQFITIFDKSGKISQKNSFDFPPEIISDYAQKSIKKKNSKIEEKGERKPELQNLFVKKLIVAHDGSLIIIGEQSYISTPDHIPGTSTSNYSTTNYYYNYMIISKINSIGELVWIKKLPKRQHGIKDIKGGMSFKHFTIENSHFLFFLDNIKNLTLSPDSYPYKHVDGEGGYITAYKVNDITGEILKLSLLNTSDINGMETFQFEPERLLPISNNEIIFEVYKKKKEDVFIKVKINE